MIDLLFFFTVAFLALAGFVHPAFVFGAMACVIGVFLLDRQRELAHQEEMAQYMTDSRQFSIRDDIHSEYRPKNVGIELSELLKNPIYRVMNDHRYQMTAKTICQKAVAGYGLDLVEAMDLFIRLSDDTGVVKRRLSRKGKWLFWLTD